jgi:uridine kinase
VLCLDDFYKDGTDPTLPREQGVIDWESPESWNAQAAAAAIAELSASGQALIPIYDISQSARVDDRLFTIDDQTLFIAEGIFAAELVTRCAQLGVLADAVALKRPRTITFARRLVRDLAEHRKAPSVLMRRGLRLWREDPAVVKRALLLGCRPMAARQIYSRVRKLRAASRTPA